MRPTKTLVAATTVILLVVCGLRTGIAQTDPKPLVVAEMGFGTGFDRDTRALVGEASTFSAGVDRIWCRTRITGAVEPTQVTHVWYRDGKTVAHVDLTVGSSNWRTVSSKDLLPDWTGVWEVRVIDAAGTLLRTETFTVELSQ